MVARGAHLRQNVWPRLEKLFAAQVHSQRDAGDSFAVVLAEVDKFRNQESGQIINAEKTIIFEGADGKTFPRAGEPRDDDDIQRFRHRQLELLVLRGDDVKELFAGCSFQQPIAESRVL